MVFKLSKLQILRGVFARRFLLRIFMFVIAMAVVPSLHFVFDVQPIELVMLKPNDCALDSTNAGFRENYNWVSKALSFYGFGFSNDEASRNSCNERANLTSKIFEDLMVKKLVNSGASVLCIGEGSALAVHALRELGFSDAFGIDKHPFPWLVRKGFIYNLPLRDKSFDFIFSRDLDRAVAPALLILEIERILKPGGIGAILVITPGSSSSSLIKSATPISAFLKNSDVVQISPVGSSTLVIFKKKSISVSLFQSRVPDECPSIRNNKPLMKHLEPLVEEESVEARAEFAYLPNFMDISTRKRFLYIDIGAGEFNSSSIANWFLPFYPIQSRSFEIYAMDHDTSIGPSYAERPGITFVHYPDLSARQVFDLETVDATVPSPNLVMQGFDFIRWIKEAATAGDFVVLKIDARGLEFKLLHELFESGTICLVDELFLRCPHSADTQSAEDEDCLSLFKALRDSGVFVHQW